MEFTQATGPNSASGCGSPRQLETGLAVWTVTAWQDEQSLVAFRDSGAHGRAQPQKPRWFDEAAITRWHQESAELPCRKTAAEPLRATGRLSMVMHPSRAQARGEIVVT